jgi:hypothetical protein
MNTREKVKELLDKCHIEYTVESLHQFEWVYREGILAGKEEQMNKVRRGKGNL